MFIISCNGRYFLPVYGNGYVFMEIPQSLIIFDAPFTVKLLYNHEIPVLHGYKKNGRKKFH